MLFNSLDFAIFLPIVFLLYWFAFQKNLKAQNAFLVLASYVFYGWWDWRFLSLIMFSSIVDYLVGQGLAMTERTRQRRLLILVSIAVNLGFLGFFKYYNFFLANFVEAFQFFGHPINPQGLHIILPVGISFYTFQTLSYSLDVYWRKLEPTKDAVSFFAFVSFFPQLVAGPIERATHLLPQFYQSRKFEPGKAADGLRQILWGLFKKIVIADNCAAYVNDVYGSYQDHTGSTLVIAVILFTFQIYGDFSGYSDIAIGSARLFGFSLMQNFAFPLFSRDIAEFWRRWHISLSTWFRDYVYIPLGGSRGSVWKKVRNIFIIFIVSGFWHGANWTFIVWGALNAALFLPLMLTDLNRRNTDTVAQGKLFPSPLELVQMMSMFAINLLAWMIFRSASVTDSVSYLSIMLSRTLFSMPSETPRLILIAVVVIMVAVEWLQREHKHGLELDGIAIPRVIRWGIYSMLIWIILYVGGSQQEFIYFQF